MRNPPAAFKHADPTHLEFGKSADSSLLAKRRQNFDYGGHVARGNLASHVGASWVDESGKRHDIPENYDTTTGFSEGVPNMAMRLDPTGKAAENYNLVTGAVMPPDQVKAALAPPPAPRAAPEPSGSVPHIRTGKGTGRVNANEYPGWPTM